MYCVIKQTGTDMKVYGEIGLKLHDLPSYFQGNGPRYRFNKKMSGSQSGSGRGGEQKSLCKFPFIILQYKNIH